MSESVSNRRKECQKVSEIVRKVSRSGKSFHKVSKKTSKDIKNFQKWSKFVRKECQNPSEMVRNCQNSSDTVRNCLKRVKSCPKLAKESQKRAKKESKKRQKNVFSLLLDNILYRKRTWDRVPTNPGNPTNLWLSYGSAEGRT